MFNKKRRIYTIGFYEDLKVYINPKKYINSELK
jgi:hypothetical protein